MQENNFQDLQVFEDPYMNKICDLFTNEVYGITHRYPLIVGSVAKMLAGNLEETYTPKDVDFTIDSIAFRQLINRHQIDPLFPFAKMIEIRPERILVWTNEKVIELWNWQKKNDNEILTLYKDKIIYLWQ